MIDHATLARLRAAFYAMQRLIGANSKGAH